MSVCLYTYGLAHVFDLGAGELHALLDGLEVALDVLYMYMYMCMYMYMYRIGVVSVVSQYMVYMVYNCVYYCMCIYMYANR
jgi:hypothetical protein